MLLKRNKIFIYFFVSNKLFIKDYYDDELQMAANDIGNFVSVEAPEGFKNYDGDADDFSTNNENIVSYDVDMDNSYNTEDYQIDWDTLFGVSDGSAPE